MPSWRELAEDALKQDKSLIKADTTFITKFGATAVGVVTLTLTALLGESWNLDPNRPSVLIAAAIIVAAVVLGICATYANDVHTRGMATVARLQALTQLAELEAEQKARGAEEKAKDYEVKLAKAVAERDEARLDLVTALQAEIADGRIVVVERESHPSSTQP